MVGRGKLIRTYSSLAESVSECSGSQGFNGEEFEKELAAIEQFR